MTMLREVKMVTALPLGSVQRTLTKSSSASGCARDFCMETLNWQMVNHRTMPDAAIETAFATPQRSPVTTAITTMMLTTIAVMVRLAMYVEINDFCLLTA